MRTVAACTPALMCIAVTTAGCMRACPGPQGSNILTAMARANGLAICPEDVTRLETGDETRVELLGETGISGAGAQASE